MELDTWWWYIITIKSTSDTLEVFLKLVNPSLQHIHYKVVSRAVSFQQVFPKAYTPNSSNLYEMG